MAALFLYFLSGQYLLNRWALTLFDNVLLHVCCSWCLVRLFDGYTNVFYICGVVWFLCFSQELGLCGNHLSFPAILFVKVTLLFVFGSTESFGAFRQTGFPSSRRSILTFNFSKDICCLSIVANVMGQRQWSRNAWYRGRRNRSSESLGSCMHLQHEFLRVHP